MLKKRFKLLSASKIFLLMLLLVGSLTWSLTMMRSGWRYSYGLGFWGANGHDGIWHIALAESVLKGFPIKMPVFSGELIKNYHLGFDLFLAFLAKETGISVSVLYFQIVPLMFSLLIGFLAYRFSLLFTGRKKAGLWSLFFIYFGGGFSFLIHRGESAFWSQQAISTLINPPFAMSLIFFLAGMIFLTKLEKTQNKLFLLLAALVFGVLISIKSYAGVLVLGGLLVSGIFQFIRDKKTDILQIFLISLIISLLLFYPIFKTSSKMFVFQPFWFLETMMGLSDRLGWNRFFSAMTTYKMGKFYFKFFIFYFLAFLIFIVGNLGTRIIFLKKIFSKPTSYFDTFILSVFSLGILIPTFFIQKGTPWNTIQFFYYSLFLAGLYAGHIISKIKNKLILVLTVIATFPTTAISLKDIYLPQRPPAKLTLAEFEALNFLKNREDGVVLTYPFDSYLAKEAEKNPPRPLNLYESTAYVAAYSGKTTFLEDEVNLNIIGYDWQTRKKEIENWYQEKNEFSAKKFLRDNKIRYIYWLKDQRAYLGEGQLGLEKIFENREVDIYVVKSL